MASERFPSIPSLSHPIQVIIPKESELLVENEVKCAIEGCQKTFKSSSSYRMHMTRHHKGVCLTPVAPGNSTSKLFYCPVSGCNRSLVAAGKPFPRLGQLKQHYNTVHATKSFICNNCGRGFGLKDAHARHVKECGRVFICESCDITFRSSNALYQHQKRSHSVKKKVVTPSSQITPTILLTPLVVKSVLPIPKVSDTSAQTVAIETRKQYTDQRNDKRDDEPINISDFSGEFLELGTQTDISCDDFLINPTLLNTRTSSTSPLNTVMADNTHQSVQTNIVTSCEFGTQTLYSTNSLSTSTEHDWTEALPRPPLDIRSHDLSLVDELLLFNDFGTQTLNDFTGEGDERITRDQESQT